MQDYLMHDMGGTVDKEIDTMLEIIVKIYHIKKKISDEKGAAASKANIQPSSTASGVLFLE